MAIPTLDSLLDEKKKKKKKEQNEKSETKGIPSLKSMLKDDDDIAPVKKTTSSTGLFKKGAFGDDEGNFVTDSILGIGYTPLDIGVGVAKGGFSMVEGLKDFLAYGMAGVSDLVGADEFADSLRKQANKSDADFLFGGIDDYVSKHSFLGDTGDAVSQGLGQVGAMMTPVGLAGKVGALGKVGQTLLSSGLMFGSSAGSGMSQAYNEGATDKEALLYGSIQGGADALSELMFGGLGKTVKAVGLGSGLSSADDMLARKLSSKISNTVAKNLVEFGVKAGAEGTEEVVAGLFSALGKKVTYMEEEELSQLIKDENLLEQFVVGSMTSGVMQSGVIPGMKAGSLIEANKTGTDFITGLTQNEQKVVDKEIENRIKEAEKDGQKLSQSQKNDIEEEVYKHLEKGYISIDTIESALGGETYNQYQSIVDNETKLEEEEKSLREIYNKLNKMKLGEMTGEQTDKKAEIKARLDEITQLKSDKSTQNQKTQLKTQLYEEVKEIAKSDRLSEAYNERERHRQKIELDAEQYDNEHAKKTVQNVLEYGKMDNTNRARDFVDLLTKVSADKGVTFRLMSTEQLQETKDNGNPYGIEEDPSRIEAFAKGKEIVINMDAGKSLGSLVGHELTHTMEKAGAYKELRDAVIEYAKTKGDYDARMLDIKQRYKGQNYDLETELVSDVVGEYVFKDDAFIENLSATKPNIFKRIYNEIKYLVKKATAGSSEHRKLLEVQRKFEKLYQQSGNKAEKNAKYSISDKNINIEVNDYYSGEMFATMSYTQDGEVVGTLEYSVYDGEPNVKMIEVSPEYRRQGIGKKLLQELQRQYPDVEINFGYTTPDGTKLLENVLYTVEDKALAEKFSRLEELERKITEYDEGYNHFFDNDLDIPENYAEDYDDILDEVYKLKSELRGKKKSKTFVKTDTKYSLSSDSDGKQLTDAQKEYFKDSKVVDENGNLKVMYHGTEKGGFHEFIPGFSDDERSFFFTDNNATAKSYSGTHENYIPKTFRSAEDFNNFFAEINSDEYEVKEENGQFVLYEDGDEVATSETADGIYEEFRDWTGLGYGSSNYKVYLNLKNPLIVDARRRNWDEVSSEFSQELYDKYQTLTAEEKSTLTSIAEWDDMGIFRDEIQTAGEKVKQGRTDEYLINLASAYEKLGGEDVNMYRLFDIAFEEFSEDVVRENSLKYLTTRDYSKRAKEQGYDGVIFKNIVDNGLYASGMERFTPSTVAIAFDSNQIKSVANENPTSDADIRYSLSEDSEGRELSKEQKEYFKDSVVRDENGSLKVMYHGTANDFTVFNPMLQGGKNGTAEGFGLYFSDNTEVTDAYGDKQLKGYLNVKRPASSNEKTIKARELEKLIKATCEKEAQKFVDDGDYDTVDEAIRDTWISNYVDTYSSSIATAYKEVTRDILRMNSSDMDIVQEVMSGMAIRSYESAYEFYDTLKATIGVDGYVTEWENPNDPDKPSQIVVVFDSNQFKNVDNKKPTTNPDIRYALKDNSYKRSKYDVLGRDIMVDESVNDVAPVNMDSPSVQEAPVGDKMSPVEELFPSMTEEEANERDAYYGDRPYDDVPEEVEAPYYGEPESITPDNPFDARDIQEVGNRKTKAYMYENPEVKPYFQEEAEYMLGELQNSIKGERTFNDHLYYETAGEQGWFATKRETSEEIAYLLDNFKYTYADIEKGLKAIIEDNGKENNAISKRIEFMLDERLREGHEDFTTGEHIPANQDYINLLVDKQIHEYSDEAYNEWLQTLAEEEPVEVDMEDFAPIKEPEQKMSVSEEDTMSKQLEEKEEIARILDTEPKTESDRNKRKWAIFKANVFDKGAVFEDVALKHKNRELMGKWNYTLYSESRAQRLIGSGNAENNVKSLNDIRAEVENSGVAKHFYEYIYHKHNVDRMRLAERYEDVPNKPVFGYEVTAEMSQEIVDQYELAEPRFMDYAQDVYNYMNYLRQQLVDNGVIAQETADLWSDMYPHYVPIRRVGDTGLNINVPLDTGRTGVNAPIKKATGGSSDILPLFDTMASRTMQTYKATAKNSFGVELKNTIGTQRVSAKTSIDELIDSIDMQEKLLQEGTNGRKPTFTVFENGERVTFEITEDMYDALKPVSSSSMLSKTITPLNVASNLHRGLLTEYNPVFLLTNAVKDTQDVLMNSQHSARTYLKIPEAHKQILTKGYWYNEYMENGGDQNTYFDNQTNTFKTENKGIKKLLDIPPLSTISSLNNYIEMIPRLAEYIASREAGRSIEVSMLDSARVTTNFRAGGDFTKFLNRNGVTFLNASVQGAMQQVRNVREAKANGMKGWMNLATKFAIAGLPAFLLNNFVWDDDEEYEELSDYVKQNYYIVGKYDDGKFIRIPKGRTVAVIQEAIRQISNVATGNDEADLNSFLELAISNLAPNNPLDNNILAPIKQVVENKTWYGEDLVPTRLQDLPASEQFDESTDKFSKWLGEKLDISPYKINYLLDQYSGGIGDVVLPMLTPEAESGADSFGEFMLAPFKSKFTTDSVLNNQNISDFYETSEKLTTNAKKSNATEEDVLMNKYINSIKSEMSDLYKEKREIQNSNLSNKTKYERVREIQRQLDELSKKALNTYEGVTIDGDYARVGDRHYRLNDEGEWTKINDKQLEKQEEVTSGLNVSEGDYWNDKSEYDFAYESPGKYSIAKAVGGYDSYKSYSKELNEFRADKDSNGKTISGSAKAKKKEYIFSLDLDYGQQVILYRSLYDSKADKEEYNEDIVDYLNSRDDISWEDMRTILLELDFEVEDDGTIRW